MSPDALPHSRHRTRLTRSVSVGLISKRGGTALGTSAAVSRTRRRRNPPNRNNHIHILLGFPQCVIEGADGEWCVCARPSELRIVRLLSSLESADWATYLYSHLVGRSPRKPVRSFPRIKHHIIIGVYRQCDSRNSVGECRKHEHRKGLPTSGLKFAEDSALLSEPPLEALPHLSHHLRPHCTGSNLNGSSTEVYVNGPFGARLEPLGVCILRWVLSPFSGSRACATSRTNARFCSVQSAERPMMFPILEGK